MTNSTNVYLFEKVSISRLLSNANSATCRILGFFFQLFKHSTSVTSCAVSEEESDVILALAPQQTRCFFPSDFFQGFPSSLIFCTLNMTHAATTFWHLLRSVFSDLPGSVVWCLSLTVGTSQPFSLQMFLLFFSLFLLNLVFP